VTVKVASIPTYASIGTSALCGSLGKVIAGRTFALSDGMRRKGSSLVYGTAGPSGGASPPLPEVVGISSFSFQGKATLHELSRVKASRLAAAG
jgi:hypothetical protein